MCLLCRWTDAKCTHIGRLPACSPEEGTCGLRAGQLPCTRVGSLREAGFPCLPWVVLWDPGIQEHLPEAPEMGNWADAPQPWSCPPAALPASSLADDWGLGILVPMSISVWCFSQKFSLCVCVCEYRKSSLENSFVCSVLHVCSALPLRILNELTYIAYFN